MATLGTFFAGTAFALRGKEKAKEQGPPINATSKEEEAFIKYVARFLWVYDSCGYTALNNMSKIQLVIQPSMGAPWENREAFTSREFRG